MFATEDELTARLGNRTAPADITGALQAASGLVRHATMGAVYSTFSDGTAVHPPVRHALRDATLAQVLFWAANEIDPTAGTLGASGDGRVVSSKSIKGASISYDTAAAREAAEARPAAVTTLCDQAIMILIGAGLLSAVVR